VETLDDALLQLYAELISHTSNVAASRGDGSCPALDVGSARLIAATSSPCSIRTGSKWDYR
jgi:hypothetical protein